MLNDPKNLAPKKLDALNQKITAAKTRLACSASNTKTPGMPFVYSFVATKKHYLSNSVFPEYIDKNGEKKISGTAATDGRKYFWDPDFLEELSLEELIIIF